MSKLEEAANAFADEHGFRVPYNVSGREITNDDYYDKVDIKASMDGFIAGAEWQKENMWISVEEELPPCSYNDLFLLGIDSEGNVDVVDIGYMHHGKANIPRIDLFVSGKLAKVTHWMPIPKIKKGE